MISLFLSASVPLPDRGSKYFRTADALAIGDSIKALVYTALSRSKIVFGGHPAITPLIANLIRGLPVEVRRQVILYQSALYRDQFVPENDEYIDLRIVAAVEGGEGPNLLRMRREMISSEPFDAAIYIGGMDGVWDEYTLFAEYHPNALNFPVASTGGAALELYEKIATDRKVLLLELTYAKLFRRLLREIENRKKTS